jgi:hypothetical protein
MTHSEAPISITVKSAAGSLVTVRASNADELDQTIAMTLASLASATEELEKAVRGTTYSAPAQAPATPMNPATGYIANAMGGTVVEETWNKPQPFEPAPAPAGSGQRMCPHGTMTRIHGMTGKFGPYKGHFCPAKQGDPTKCTTQYVKAGSAEFATFVADQTKA